MEVAESYMVIDDENVLQSHFATSKGGKKKYARILIKNKRIF